MKVLKVLIGVSIVFVLGISIWNRLQMDKYAAMYEFQKKENLRIADAFKEIQEGVIESYRFSLAHVDKTLVLNGIRKMHHVDKYKLVDHKPKIVLVLSEFGCNVCADAETSFAINVSKRFGSNGVLAVMHANSKRFARDYIRVNQVNFPVYFCEDETFFDDNKILNTPLLLLLNADNRVIASHLPVPGHPEYSDPFHKFCVSYIKANYK